jgi:hypothetical protein
MLLLPPLLLLDPEDFDPAESLRILCLRFPGFETTGGDALLDFLEAFDPAGDPLLDLAPFGLPEPAGDALPLLLPLWLLDLAGDCERLGFTGTGEGLLDFSPPLLLLLDLDDFEPTGDPLLDL